MASPEQVSAAVHALYGAHDPSQQQQANQWLLSFQKSEQAWRVPFVLLVPEQPDEVQFFAATLLIQKVRTEWVKLDQASKQDLSQAIRAKFQEALGWPRVGDLVLRQLCALLAAVAGASGGEGANDLATQALGLLREGAPLALHLLSALAEEGRGLDRTRRLALANVLVPRARETLGALGSLLQAAAHQAQAGHPAGEAAAVAALQCAEAWLGLNPLGGSGPCFTPGQLHSQQGQLLGAALALLPGGGGPHVTEAAVQLLLAVFGPEGFAEEPADLAATSALARALLACAPRLADPGGDALAAGVAKLAGAAAERLPDYVCGAMAEAAALGDLMLGVLGRGGGPDLAALTLDYFLVANTVPLAERPPQLRQPLYEAVLPRAAAHASYPASFTCWEEEGELDEEAFERLREQHLPELLDVCYGLLRAAYLAHAWHALQSARSWQAAEASLYLVAAVGLAVKARLLGGGGDGDENGGGGASQAVAEDRRQTRALLSALLSWLCSEEGRGQVLGAHPLLAAAACRLLDRYSAWLAQAGGEGVPLQAALQLPLHALSLPAAAPAAARAFQQLCLRCVWRLRDVATAAWLTRAALEAVQQAGPALPLAQRQLVVEGLARVAAGLQGQQLLEAAASLTRPFLAQAAAAAAAGTASPPGPDAAARRSLAEGLHLLAAALRFLAPAGDDSGQLGSQPAAAALAAAEPTLRAVAQSAAWRADGEAVGAVVEVYRRAVGTARRHGLQLALACVDALGSLFAATARPECLDGVAEALEQQCGEAAAAQAAVRALAAACDAALPRLQGGALRQHPALASSLLHLAAACAAYAPAALYASPALGALLQLATAAVALREADPVAAALQLAAKLAAAWACGGDEGVSAAHLEAVRGVLAAQGPALVAALLAAACDTCPRHLLRTAADCLRRLLAHPELGGAAGGWLAAAATSGQLPGAAEGYLSPQDCAAFARLAPGLQGARFLALFSDFGLLARGHNTSDVLLAYEL